MIVFLIGFMGAGKTTLGKALAKQLNWHFIDLDKEVEQFCGCTISQLFARDGESKFREIEQQVLHNVVGRFQDPLLNIRNGVIACGGGTPCFKENLSFMKKNGFVIYLEVSPEILCERLLRTPAARPLIPSHNPKQLPSFVRNLLGQRRSIYEAAHWKC